MILHYPHQDIQLNHLNEKVLNDGMKIDIHKFDDVILSYHIIWMIFFISIVVCNFTFFI